MLPHSSCSSYFYAKEQLLDQAYNYLRSGGSTVYGFFGVVQSRELIGKWSEIVESFVKIGQVCRVLPSICVLKCDLCCHHNMPTVVISITPSDTKLHIFAIGLLSNYCDNSIKANELHKIYNM